MAHQYFSNKCASFYFAKQNENSRSKNDRRSFLRPIHTMLLFLSVLSQLSLPLFFVLRMFHFQFVNAVRREQIRVTIFGVLGALPLGEGVAENGSSSAADGWSEGETSPTFCNTLFLANFQFSIINYKVQSSSRNCSTPIY